MATKLLIPASVKTIDTSFLSDFLLCEEYAVDEKNENYKSVDGVIFDPSGETLIGYPHSKPDAEYEVPAKTEKIGERAFYNNYALTKVTFPKSLRTIGEYAFGACSNLTTVEFNKGLKEIGNNAFSTVPLANVTLPSSIVTIGSSAITLTQDYGRLELPEKLEKMGLFAFGSSYDSSFTQDVIRIPARLKFEKSSINRVLFEKYEVDEKNEYHTVVDGMLMSKDGMTLTAVPTLMEGDLIVPEGTLYIDYAALDYCDLITDIYLPDSILDAGGAISKDYSTGEYKYVIHCSEGSEVQKALDAKGIPWEAR